MVDEKTAKVRNFKPLPKIKIKSRERLRVGEEVVINGSRYRITSVNQRNRYMAKRCD